MRADIARLQDERPGLRFKAAKLVVDAEFRQQMGAAAERFVRDNFDAPVLAARQAAIYEEILDKPLRSSHPAQASQPDLTENYAKHMSGGGH